MLGKLVDIQERAGEGEWPPRPVRVTVDLQRADYQAMRMLCLWYAEQLNVTQVAAAELFRVLLQAVLADERLAVRIGAALAETGGSQRRRAPTAAE